MCPPAGAAITGMDIDYSATPKEGRMRKVMVVLGVLAIFLLPASSVFAACSRQLNSDGFGDSANVGIYAMTRYRSVVYFGTRNINGSEVWRSANGTDFTKMTQTAGGFGDANNTLIHSMAAGDDIVLAGTYNDVTGCELWASSDGTTWQQFGTDGFGAFANVEIPVIGNFGDYFYVGIYNPGALGCEIFRSETGASFEAVVGAGSGTLPGFGDNGNKGARSMMEHQDGFYVGTYRDSGGCQIWKTANGTTWTNVVGTGKGGGPGFGDVNNTSCDVLEDFNGNLYAGTQNDSTGGEIWRSADGADWTQVNTDGFGDNSNMRILDLVVMGQYLYASTENDNGCELWRSYDGTAWEQVNTAGFGDTDNIESRAMVVAGDRLYSGTYNDSTGCELWSTFDNTNWYLAEGSTLDADFIDTWISIQNPNGAAAVIDITYMDTDGNTYQLQDVDVPAKTRIQRNINAVMDNVNGVSTRVQSTNGVGVIVERPMYLLATGAGSDSVGTTVPNENWYLAEGSTLNYETWICVQNPTDDDATVYVTYMDKDGNTAELNQELKGNRRASFNVAATMDNEEGVSTHVESAGVPIIAERAMYWSVNGLSRMGAHASIGAPSPSLTWFFAEGSTQTDYSTWICIQNPRPGAATVDITYMADDGTTAKIEGLSIAALSRETKLINDLLPGKDGVSTMVEVTNGIPVVAERAVYWGGVGGHCSIGSTAPAETWYLAEGSTSDYDTWICVQNPNSSGTANVNITYMANDGTTAVLENIQVAPFRRITRNVNATLPNKEGVSTQVESTNGVNVVAERAVYWNSGVNGHCSKGVTY